MKPRKAKLDRDVAYEEAEREASAYVRAVLERVNDASYLPRRGAHHSRANGRVRALHLTSQ